MTAKNRSSLSFAKYARIAISILLLTVILSVAALASFADTENNGLDIEITLDKEQYAEGDDVTIMLYITNNTGKKIENVSARYYIPDCFEVSEDTVTSISVLNSRQGVPLQVHAIAKSAVGSNSIVPDEKSDRTLLYIALIIASAVIFISAVTLLIFRERNRRKIAATISFVFALILCLSPFAAFVNLSASTSDPVTTSDMTYEDAKSIIGKLFPDDYAKIIAQLSPSSELTRERAAIITSIMLLGRKELPASVSKTYLDVSSDLFSVPYIDLAVSEGIILPITANRFEPTTEVSGYQFVEYTLRAAGFGANGEYKGQRGRASVISDALSLPYTDARELLTEETLTCSQALCHALKIMLNPSVSRGEGGEYLFTKQSLISNFNGVEEKKAFVSDEKTLITENGKKIELREKTLEKGVYSVLYHEGSPLSVTPDFSTIDYNFVSVYAGKEEREIGVGIEYSSPAPKSEYSVYTGRYDENSETHSEVFTSDNVHYTVDKNAFENTFYMIDAKVSDKSYIDYDRTVIFIAKVDSSSASMKITDVFCVYQLSSDESANYVSFISALASAREITNDTNLFLPSAYERFIITLDIIDKSLARDLTDTEESRALIAQAESDIKDAVSELDKYLLESYAELDAEILRAQEYLSRSGEYTEKSIENLKAAVISAQNLSRELLLGEENKATIAACKSEISKAITGLVYSNFCDYTKYNTTLSIAKQITNENGKYNASDFSSFQKTINDIDKKLKKDLPRSEANQKLVDDARAKINDAIEKLNSKLPCDYSSLDSAISKAEAKVEKDPDNKTCRWTSGSFAEFKEALTAAKKVKRNMTLGYGSTNQSTINAAAAFLFSATDTLTENAKQDLTAFDTKLAEAQGIKNDENTYEAASYALFTQTLGKIKERLDAHGTLYKCDASQKIVDAAIADIDASIARLSDPKPCDYTKLTEKLAEIEMLDRTPYTAKSLALLDKAVADAKAITPDMLNDIYSDNQAIIDNAIKAIDDAKTALVTIKTFAAEVLSAVYEKEISSETDGTVKQNFIKVLFDGKEKEFALDAGITERPEIGDIIIVKVGGDEILSIEIASVEVGGFVEGSTLSEIEKHISFAPLTPSAGDRVVFFKNSSGDIIFISAITEKLGEIVYDQSKLTLAGKEIAILSGSDFTAFSKKTLAKVFFAGRFALSAEALAGGDVTVSLSSDKAVYKESADGEEKFLEASSTLFEAEEGSTFLTLEKVVSYLKAEGAAKAYKAKIYLDANGKLIACQITEAVVETPETPDNPDIPDNSDQTTTPGGEDAGENGAQ